MPNFHIKTYGCQMNERDSEALACLLEAKGYCEVSSEEDADVMIFNTCSVRDQAERKAIGKVGFMKKLKQRRPGMVVGIVGCMAQNHGGELLRSLPVVDFVAGTDQLHRVPELVERARGGERIVADGLDREIRPELDEHRYGDVCAQVAVMRGCDQFCSYCIVPHTRGREKSRPIPAIVDEVKRLVDGGTREILLLGQNITAYGVAEARRAGAYDPKTFSGFADLLRAVHEVPGLARIRFTSPHVHFMNEPFIRAIAELPKVCKCFHIPLQSGSDRILKLMRRSYTSSDYMACIDAIRGLIPEVNFTTDVIVGFPSETEEEFGMTRELMRRVVFDMAYIFRYSPREGTKSANEYPDDVSEETKHERNQLLLSDLEEGACARNARFQGTIQEVLVEGVSKRNPDRWTGRTTLNKVVNFVPREGVNVGDLVDLRIRRTTANSLFGEFPSCE